VAFFPRVPGLELVGVFDPGVPNQERIVVRVTTPVDLTATGIVLGVLWEQAPAGTRQAFPIDDYLFWFEPTQASPPLWLFVYTGKGETRRTTLLNSAEPAVVMHWNKSTTLFGSGPGHARLVPLIFRVGAIDVGVPPPPAPLPQPNAVSSGRRT
jgi:hypothetical protein